VAHKSVNNDNDDNINCRCIMRPGYTTEYSYNDDDNNNDDIDTPCETCLPVSYSSGFDQKQCALTVRNTTRYVTSRSSCVETVRNEKLNIGSKSLNPISILASGLGHVPDIAITSDNTSATAFESVYAISSDETTELGHNNSHGNQIDGYSYPNNDSAHYVTSNLDYNLSGFGRDQSLLIHHGGTSALDLPFSSDEALDSRLLNDSKLILASARVKCVTNTNINNGNFDDITIKRIDHKRMEPTNHPGWHPGAHSTSTATNKVPNYCNPNTLKSSSSNNNTCNVLAATIPSPTSISTLAEVGSVALSVNTNKRPRQPATKNSDEHYAIVSGLQASSTHIPFTFRSSTIASSICSEAPSPSSIPSQNALPNKIKQLPRSYQKSKDKADYRSKLSDADKDRIRQCDTLRRAKARAALKLIKPLKTTALNEIEMNLSAINMKKRKKGDSIPHEDTSAKRSKSSFKLAVTEYDRQRQLNTQQRATLRANQYHVDDEARQDTLETHALGETMPTNELLNLFEKDPYAAQIRFAVGSGFNAHEDAFLNPVLDEDTGHPVLSDVDRVSLKNVKPIAENDLMKAMKGFMHATDSAQRMNVCSSCGITGLAHNSNDRVFTVLPLYDEVKGWNTTMFGNKKKAIRKTLFELFKIEETNIPKYTVGKYCTIWNSAVVNGTYLHLYSDYLIRDANSGNVSISLCQDCKSEVSAAETPTYNLKHCDFGNLKEFSRIVLNKSHGFLSVAERVVTSPSVVFDSIVKTSVVRNGTFTKGHCIAFLHDGKDKSAEVLPRTLVTDESSKYLTMAFVGTAAKWKNIRSSPEKRANYFRTQPLLMLRAQCIKDYLAFKCEMDPHYVGVENTSSLQSIEQLRAELVTLHDDIMNNAIECDTDTEILLDEQLHDNVATEASDRFPAMSLNEGPRELDTDMSLSENGTTAAAATDSKGAKEDSFLPSEEMRNEPDENIEDEEITERQVALMLENAHFDHVFMSPTMEHGTTTVSAFLNTVKSQCFDAKGAESRNSNNDQAASNIIVNAFQNGIQNEGLNEPVTEAQDDHQHHISNNVTAARSLDAGSQTMTGNRNHITSITTLSDEVAESIRVLNSAIPAGHYAPLLDPSHTSTIHPVQISAEPDSEYGGNNHDLLYKAFPDLFLLGQGLGAPSKRPCLSQRELDHMLLHADGRFGKSMQVIFLLFNQMQRSQLNLRVGLKVDGKADSMEKFSALVNKPSFEKDLTTNIENPDSRPAIDMAQEILKITKSINSKVPWSYEQRSSARSNLLAAISYTGPFSYFITIAPGHHDSVLCLRISTIQNYNEDHNIANIDFPLPSYQARARKVSSDPVAAARLYKLLIESFLIFLVGKKPSYLSKRESTLPKSSNLTEFNESMGIFGEVYFYGLVNEEQAKGPEHAHAALTSDTGPLTLQKYLNDPQVLLMLTDRIDSIVRAYIPSKPEALFMSNVLSTKLPACVDSKTPTRRDLRYHPTESHTNAVIKQSIQYKINIASSNASKSEIPIPLSTDKVGTPGTVVDSGLIKSIPEPASSSSNNASTDFIAENNIDNELRSDDPDLLARLESDPSEHDLLILRRAVAVAVSNNLHNHSATCTKGPTGLLKCRMAYPRATNNRPTELIEIEMDCKCNVPKARTYFSVKKPVVNSDILQNLFDDRVIVLELFRPSDDYNHECREKYEEYDPDQIYWADATPGVNSYIVSYSPALSAMFASNLNVEVLGNSAQSKGATYYIIKYMTKDGGQVQSILPVLLAAHRKVKRYESRALDAGTPDRNVKHLLSVLMNGLNGKVEIGAETACCALLGLPSNIFSHEFSWLFIRAAIAYVKEKISEHHRNNGTIEMDDGLHSDDEHILADGSVVLIQTQTEQFLDTDNAHHTIFDQDGMDQGTQTAADAERNPKPIDIDGEEDVDLDWNADNRSVGECAAGDRDIVPRQKSGDKVMTVSQIDNYIHRGALLGNYTLYEWVASVRVCLKKADKRSDVSDIMTTEDCGDVAAVADDDEDEENELQRGNNTVDNEVDADLDYSHHNLGRQKNATFEFSEGHPLRGRTQQRLRSKQHIPMFGGGPSPRHPGVYDGSKAWQRKGDEFAKYFLIMHRPFSVDDITNTDMIELNYAALIKYVDALELSSKLIDKARLRWLKIATQGMSIKAKHLKLLSAYRGRCTEYWNGNIPTSNKLGQNHGVVDGSSTHVVGAEQLQELSDVYRSFSDANAVARAAIKANIDIAITQLNIIDCFKDPDTSLEGMPSSSKMATGRFDDGTKDANVSTLRDVYNRVTKYRRGDNELQEDTSEDLGDSIANVGPVDYIVDEQIDGSLNRDQARAMKIILKYYNENERHIADPEHYSAVEPVRIVILGRAGSGKTYWVEKLQEALHRKGAILCTAPTGVASTLLPDGYTVHSAFGFQIEEGITPKEPSRIFLTPKKSRKPKPAASLNQRQQRRLKFIKDLRFLIIDEFSMLQAELLVAVDKKLREWTGQNIAFGGIAVILMGDEFQLFPVGMSVLSASMDTTNIGGQLFNSFQRISFNVPERSTDAVLNEKLLFFRTPTVNAQPVRDSGILNLLTPLRNKDNSDPMWQDATIVVPGNEQRYAINMSRAVSYAWRTNQPVIAWKLPLHSESKRTVNIIALSKGTTSQRLLEAENETTMYFVKGARAIVSDNIATDLRIANGTRCTMHSLLLNPATAEKHWSNIHLTEPGEVYWLPDDDIPLFLNVEFKKLSADDWDPSMTIVPNAIVIPMPLCIEKYCKKAKTLDLASSNCRFFTHYIELAYAVTFYKVQGSTLDRVILDLNHVGGHSKTIDLSALYVGLSRVKKLEHIRALPLTAVTREYLSGLRFRDAVIRWTQNAPMQTLL
jgi:hypothetical protein